MTPVSQARFYCKSNKEKAVSFARFNYAKSFFYASALTIKETNGTENRSAVVFNCVQLKKCSVGSKKNFREKNTFQNECRMSATCNDVSEKSKAFITKSKHQFNRFARNNQPMYDDDDVCIVYNNSERVIMKLRIIIY